MPLSPNTTRPSAPSGGRGPQLRPWLIGVAAAVVLGTASLIAGARPGSPATPESSYGDSVVAAGTEADTQRVALHVEGMSCESCERTITVMLKRTPGVVRAAVSVERSEAVVVFDPARTSPPKLIDVIASLGYKASLRRT